MSKYNIQAKNLKDARKKAKSQLKRNEKTSGARKYGDRFVLTDVKFNKSATKNNPGRWYLVSWKTKSKK